MHGLTESTGSGTCRSRRHPLQSPFSYMRSQLFSAFVFTVWAFAPRSVHAAESLPAADQRAGKVKDLNTPREFPAIHSRSEWESRSKEIREQILVSCGLWPLPEKT